MQFQWYPGHMTKAKRMMQENMQLIDLMIELLDARVPMSSRNPDIDTLAKNKSRLILLNKADLADPAKTALWEAYFKEKGILTVQVNARKGAGMKEIQTAVAKACEEKIARDRKRGILNRPVRAMVAGIPNVGKSTFINSFAGKACTKTGNRPGVTKGKQWIRLNKNVELLDTPGILWPRFEDQVIGERLALIGSMNDEVLQLEELALRLIDFLQKEYPSALAKQYGIESEKMQNIAAGSEERNTAVEMTEQNAGNTGKVLEGSSLSILEKIAVRRGCIKTGALPDFEKAAQLLLDDFRNGRIGRITLEIPDV